jgi:hypothetical protein
MTPPCPKCGKYFTKRVLMEGAEDPTSTMQGMYAYRCQLCGELFRARKPPLQSTPAPSECNKDSELSKLTARQYVRVTVKFPATFVVGKTGQEGLITEIALGGCSLEANVVLAIGAKFRMDILISTNEPPLVVHQALVRSVRPTGFGIQFMDIQDAEKERLGRLLEKLLAAQLA